MTEPLLLDTDVVVEYLGGKPAAVSWLEARIQDELLLSVVTVAELYAGLRGQEEKTHLEEFVSVFELVPLDATIARKGGDLRREFSASHGLGLADDATASPPPRALDTPRKTPAHKARDW